MLSAKDLRSIGAGTPEIYLWGAVGPALLAIVRIV